MSRIQLRLRDAIQNQEQRIGFHLSTFDIPREALAEIDKKAGLVTFYFRYVDDEPSGATQKLSDDISIDTGKNSGKLLALRINCKRYPVGQIQVSFHAAMNEMDQAFQSLKHLKKHQQENYELVRSVINENKPAVESALATA